MMGWRLRYIREAVHACLLHVHGIDRHADVYVPLPDLSPFTHLFWPWLWNLRQSVKSSFVR